MGNAFSVNDPGQEASKNVGRAQAVTETKRKRGAARPLPVGSSKVATTDLTFITVSYLFPLLPFP
jgi:hypothetical protein